VAVVAARRCERGSALVFAVAALTLVALTVAVVAAEIRSRSAGIVLEERSLRVVALADWAMAETLAELAADPRGFQGISERPVSGGTVASRVQPLGEWELEVTAVGVRDDWQAILTARVGLKPGPRVLWWQRTQSPVPRP
jgi:hypothetical protein